ncbi:class I SAM-dependent methyltransferase [Telmatobacter bradus]|uniref:class I SAM-dependent methyltransferase n=1 Tax=Telmatobacter bradus TaxID=474953 RepID=UPI003B42AD31
MQHPFDLQHGVRTSGLVAGRNLKSGHTNDRHNTAYYGVAPSVFHDLVARWRSIKPLVPINEYTFIDVGAGMGRAMMLASELPFRAVIGVEMHPTLAGITRRNLPLWRKHQNALAPLRTHCCDALEYSLPPGPCVLFLFNPFGASMLRKLAQAWEKESADRAFPLDLLYVNHEHELVLRQRSGWNRLFADKVYRSAEDAEAERRILNHQPDGEYAATNWEDCSIFRWTNPKNTL